MYDILKVKMLSEQSNSLYQALKELNIINAEKLDRAYKVSKETNRFLGTLLLEENLISDENLGKVMSNIYGLPFIQLASTTISKEILGLIPESVAANQRIIAFSKDSRGLHVATADPTNLEVIELVKKKIESPLVLYYATDRDISDKLILYKEDINKTFDALVSENVEKAKNLKSVQATLPIIKIVDTIIDYAYQSKASDIHIEPSSNFVQVRFRIDGILHDIKKLPIEFHSQIITRIKVLSKLRIDEHQMPQDGKIQYSLEKEELDIRVSVVPITEGEKVVMRLLTERAREISLTDLGLKHEKLDKIENAYKKPYGMILSTGPTGSGKTTTLYAIVKLLNKRNINIMTIEDPVEYHMDGVNQMQVNPKTNLTFATGLRSIVRQDPNVILVGEIRDNETASIAINSAMTGHLVLSTLHTNDAATAIPRLIDMGIEPFLIASSLNVIVAQRLVRKICVHCRLSKEVKLSNLELSPLFRSKFTTDTLRVYYGKGCSVCHQTGYDGRVGIFEVLEVNDGIRKAITEKNDAAKIAKLAIENGMQTMIEDGFEKVKEAITTIEEVIRVTKE